MIPEIGHLALIIAFVFAMGLAVIPMWGAVRGNSAALNLAPTLAMGVLLFVGIAFAMLAVSFLKDDFSVAVVAANSNSLLPAIFKFSALWGNHEGLPSTLGAHTIWVDGGGVMVQSWTAKRDGCACLERDGHDRGRFSRFFPPDFESLRAFAAQHTPRWQ